MSYPAILSGFLDLYYQLILPFRSVMYTLKTGNSKCEVQTPELVSKFPFNYLVSSRYPPQFLNNQSDRSSIVK